MMAQSRHARACAHACLRLPAIQQGPPSAHVSITLAPAARIILAGNESDRRGQSATAAAVVGAAAGAHRWEGIALVPNARFLELLEDIEPSPTTKSNASVAHTGVRTHLRSHASYKSRVVDDFLAGSNIRDTALRPKSDANGVERPDVDIIIETNHSPNDLPNDVLAELAEALEDAYTVDRINKRSVRVVNSQAEMDVVPVIAWGNAYAIADRDLGGWKQTDPPYHTAWSTTRNNEFDGRFKPLVKLTKSWRRENPTGKRPKGFVLEVLVARHGPRDVTHYGECMAQLLANIFATYGQDASLGLKPFIGDPALPNSDILSKVTVAQWRDFIDRVRVHAGYARRAQDTDDMEEATRLWRKVFGPRFPATANAARASSLLAAARAPAIAPGYVFPDAAAAPKTPRGFA